MGNESETLAEARAALLAQMNACAVCQQGPGRMEHCADHAEMASVLGVGTYEEARRRALDRYEGVGAVEAHFERNLAVAAFARFSLAHGARAGVRDRESEWPAIVIELPLGPVAWRIPRHELPLDLPVYTGPWDTACDGQTERRARLLAWRPT